jgi:hypothetical protein
LFSRILSKPTIKDSLHFNHPVGTALQMKCVTFGMNVLLRALLLQFVRNVLRRSCNAYKCLLHHPRPIAKTSDIIGQVRE